MPELTGNPNQHPTSEFTESLSGHCLCHSIHVTITDPDLFTKRRGHICHCFNCRKTSGSYASINLIIEKEKVKIEDRKGTLKIYDDFETGSGRPVHRHFCSSCGNPVCSITGNFPDKIIVKMGMFPRIPAPECETFAEHRHDWQGKHDDVKMWKLRFDGETLN